MTSRRPLVVAGSGATQELQAGDTTPASALDFETTNVALALQNMRIALINSGRPTRQIKRLACGIDSLTEGTPTSVIDVAISLLGADQSNTAFWVRGYTPFYSNLAEVTDILGIGGHGVVPRCYSLDGYGLQTSGAVAGSWKQLPQNSAGPVSWQKARLFYLQQPGGGTFNYNQWDATLPGPITAVNTAGTLQLAWVDLPVSYACPSAYVQATSIVGNVVFFGILYLQNDVTTDSFAIKISQAGQTVTDWALMNASFQQQWWNALNFDHFIFNGGQNDGRSGISAAAFQTAVNTYLGFPLSATTPPSITIVEPAQSSDWATQPLSTYPPVYRATAAALGAGFFSLQDLLGSFAQISATTGMNVDGIHTSANSNLCAGYLLAYMLGCNRPNATPFPYTFGNRTPNDVFPNFIGLKSLSVGINNPQTPIHFNLQTLLSSNVGAQTLHLAVAVGDLTLTMNSVTGYNVNGGIVVIDAEAIQYTGISGLVLTGCTRGWWGTTPAIHNVSGAVTVPGCIVGGNATTPPIFQVQGTKIIFGSATVANGTGPGGLQWTTKGNGLVGSVAYGIAGNLTGLYSKASNQDLTLSVNGVDIAGALYATANKGWATYGPAVDRSIDRQTFATGGNYAALSTSKRTVNRNAATLATFSLTAPAAPIDGQEWEFMSRGAITLSSILPAAGQTIDAAPAAIAANVTYKWIYYAIGTNWDRLQ